MNRENEEGEDEQVKNQSDRENSLGHRQRVSAIPPAVSPRYPGRWGWELGVRVRLGDPTYTVVLYVITYTPIFKAVCKPDIYLLNTYSLSAHCLSSTAEVKQDRHRDTSLASRSLYSSRE